MKVNEKVTLESWDGITTAPWPNGRVQFPYRTYKHAVGLKINLNLVIFVGVSVFSYRYLILYFANGLGSDSFYSKKQLI
jgi:hypothetical protein